jgi:hypothetical protein
MQPLGLSALASDYQAGRLSKPDFIDAMGRCHASWFEYAEFLNGSEVAAIEIRPGRVVLLSSSGVRFVIDPIDRRQPICEALHFRSCAGVGFLLCNQNELKKKEKSGPAE